MTRKNRKSKTKRRNAGKRTKGLREIPFGPFLAAGTIASYFSGEHIIHLYTMMLTAGY